MENIDKILKDKNITFTVFEQSKALSLGTYISLKIINKKHDEILNILASDKS